MQDVDAAAHVLDAHPVRHAPEPGISSTVRGQRPPGGCLRATCIPRRDHGQAPQWAGRLPLAGGECRGGTVPAWPDGTPGA